MKSNDSTSYPSWYKWFILGQFSLLTFSNAFVWNTYSPLPYVFLNYYGKDDVLFVNLFSIIFMAAYPVFLYPALWVFDHPGKIRGLVLRIGGRKGDDSRYERGLRYGVLVGALLNAVGAFLRYVGSGRGGYWTAMIGQTLAAIAQVFILGI